MKTLTPLAVTGTLIVVIPTRDGVIIAADSLATVAGKGVPAPPKLHTTPASIRTIFTITGTSEFLPPPLPQTDVEPWLQTTKPIFSGENVLRDTLSQAEDVEISQSLLTTLANTLVQKFDAFISTSPEMQCLFSGQEVCRPVFVQYSAATMQTIIATFLIRSNSAGRLFVEGKNIDEMASDGPRYVGHFGEQQYVNDNVLKPGSVGWTYLGHDIETLWNGPKLIRDMVPTSAAKIATSIIAATEQASRTVPIKTAVGGKPLIILIDGKNPPRTFEV